MDSCLGSGARRGADELDPARSQLVTSSALTAATWPICTMSATSPDPRADHGGAAEKVTAPCLSREDTGDRFPPRAQAAMHGAGSIRVQGGPRVIGRPAAKIVSARKRSFPAARRGSPIKIRTSPDRTGREPAATSVSYIRVIISASPRTVVPLPVQTLNTGASGPYQPSRKSASACVATLVEVLGRSRSRLPEPSVVLSDTARVMNGIPSSDD
jgi:hypothetical protein